MIDNVTKEGKANDGFIIPAGSMFPLGCAIPNHSVNIATSSTERDLRTGTAIWNVLSSRNDGERILQTDELERSVENVSFQMVSWCLSMREWSQSSPSRLSSSVALLRKQPV